ncbi:DinB family protein [Ornithinibacillus xuwenensis]|jgi:uncharacterized damage-inducible protein DinB|uniref:DinB family protein n=1 Tax=Ornithinibacillus xuwenensis TaxID=3144668 RepID=A0ABU9XGX6_9BACI
MYRKKEDFLQDWHIASQGTIKVLEALTDEKLGQSIVEGHNTLGWLGWHLATSPSFFAGEVGLQVSVGIGKQNVPKHAKEIVDAYKKMVEDFQREVEENITDDTLVDTVNSFGRQIARGALLRSMLDHQTHHRGQMTVLLRQAGLKVPGVMGPTKEEQM